MPATAASKRTWSLPLPVQPWATAPAPWARADSTSLRAMRGRDSDEMRGYWPSYRAPAFRVGRTYSSASSRRASTISTAAAPAAWARAVADSTSTPWPTSTSRATTSARYSSASQRRATDVSRPPE